MPTHHAGQVVRVSAAGPHSRLPQSLPAHTLFTQWPLSAQPTAREQARKRISGPPAFANHVGASQNYFGNVFQNCSRLRKASGLLAGSPTCPAWSLLLSPWHEAQVRISPGWNVIQLRSRTTA